jgi:hypothetical protein
MKAESKAVVRSLRQRGSFKSHQQNAKPTFQSRGTRHSAANFFEMRNSWSENIIII